MSYAFRVVARYLAATTNITQEYIEVLLKTAGLSPYASYKLQALAKSMGYGNIDPFPMSELPEYLRARDVDEESIVAVEKYLAQKPPRPKKVVTFQDAWRQLERVTGKSIVYDGSLEYVPEAAAGVIGWIKGYKALKPKAQETFSRLVKKVRLGRGMGSEDASWTHGTLNLVVGKSVHSPGVAAFNITHELGHAVEEHANVDLHAAPWGAPPFITEYAESKPLIEDFAESFRAYVMEPSRLRRLNQAKFEALRAIVG